MIVIRPSKDDTIPDAAQSHIANLSDAVSRLRRLDDAASAPEGDLGNVVPIARARREPSRAAPEISVSPADRFLGALTTNRGRLAAFVVCSIAAHVGLYLPFMREPEPMASIGEIAVTAEIVLGANTPAGNAAQTGDAETSAPTPAQDPDPQPEAKPEPELAQAEPPKPEPEVANTEPPVPEPQPQPEPEVAVTEPQVPEPQPPEPQQVETPQPERQQTAALPEPVERKPEAAPKPVVTPQPKKPEETRKPAAKPEKPKREERRVASRGERNDSRSTAPASSTASGVGRGRSDLNTNYRGLVAAHLARHKQFPADARSRGDTGSAMVAFSLSGSGGVTSVRLVRGTGVGSLDQEATAMVRRASPFPAPPDGRSVSFTVPVSFRIQ